MDELQVLRWQQRGQVGRELAEPCLEKPNGSLFSPLSLSLILLPGRFTWPVGPHFGKTRGPFFLKHFKIYFYLIILIIFNINISSRQLSSIINIPPKVFSVGFIPNG